LIIFASLVDKIINNQPQ